MISESIMQDGSVFTQDQGKLVKDMNNFKFDEQDRLEDVLTYDLEKRYKTDDMLEAQNAYFAVLEDVLRYMKFDNKNDKGYEDIRKMLEMLIFKGFEMIYGSSKTFGEFKTAYTEHFEEMKKIGEGYFAAPQIEIYIIQYSKPLEVMINYNVSEQNVQINELIENRLLNIQEKKYETIPEKKAEKNYSVQTKKSPPIKTLYKTKREEEVPIYSEKQQQKIKDAQYQHEMPKSYSQTAKPLEKKIKQNYHHQPIQGKIPKHYSKLKQNDHYKTLKKKNTANYVKPKQNYTNKPLQKNYAKPKQNYHHKPNKLNNYKKLSQNYHQEMPNSYTKINNDYKMQPSRNYSAKDIRQNYGKSLDRKFIPDSYGIRTQPADKPLYLRHANRMNPMSSSRLANYNMRNKYSGSNAFMPKSKSLGTSGIGARRGMAKAK